jgi:hypothetical protein
MTLRSDARTPPRAPPLDVDRNFDKAFSLVAFIMNRHFMDHLLRCGRTFVDGDLEALVLLGVLAHQNVAHLMPPGTLPASVLNDQGRVAGYERNVRPMLLRDIAAITGIPRETARRKLEYLAGKGFLQRMGGGWAVSPSIVEPDLRDFTRESVRRLLVTADEVRAALLSVDAATASPHAARRR